jgi:hypothetical protein
MEDYVSPSGVLRTGCGLAPAVDALCQHLAVTYSFRNRIRLGENERVAVAAHEYPLEDCVDDGTVVLMAAGHETLISKTSDLVLQGSGYVDEASAEAAGRRWRQILRATLAHEHTGVDFGPDDRVHPITDMVIEKPPYEWLKQAGYDVGDRVIGDEIGLLVFKSEPTPKFAFLEMGTPIVLVGGRFEKNLNDARQRNGQPWGKQKSLAYQLVNAALRDSNPETQHIQLVTAIEVLLKKQNRPQPILDALKGLLAEVKRWPDSQEDVKIRIEQILNGSKEESINRAGSQQVTAILDGRYDDKSSGAFFEQVYDMRSGLVHREKPTKPRPTIESIRNIHSELLRFVLDLLDAYESG